MPNTKNLLVAVIIVLLTMKIVFSVDKLREFILADSIESV